MSVTPTVIMAGARPVRDITERTGPGACPPPGSTGRRIVRVTGWPGVRPSISSPAAVMLVTGVPSTAVSTFPRPQDAGRRETRLGLADDHSGNGGECIEVASPDGAVAVRDTKQCGTRSRALVHPGRVAQVRRPGETLVSGPGCDSPALIGRPPPGRRGAGRDGPEWPPGPGSPGRLSRPRLCPGSR